MITANDIVKANEVLKNVVERTPLDFDRYLRIRRVVWFVHQPETMLRGLPTLVTR